MWSSRTPPQAFHERSRLFRMPAHAKPQGEREERTVIDSSFRINDTQPIRQMDQPRILFSSYHCYLDFSSGAALSTRDMLEMLAARGWPVRVFCGPLLDHGPAERVEQIVSDLRMPFETKALPNGESAEAVLHCAVHNVDVSIYCAADRKRLTPQDADTFFALYERILDVWKPDVLVLYGGRPLHPLLMRSARRRGVRVVFSLHNFSYSDRELFQPADAILVPSQFSAEYYRQNVGLDCTPVPSPIIWSRVQCEPDPARRFVTFINPQRAKGVQIFARIAAELSECRPDIPLLVVESRGAADQLEKLPIDLSGCRNLHRMANTPDPRDFYSVSHILLMPSLCNESFGRVPVEAMLNGIPVLASDRGSLPEVMGEAGFLIPIPDRHRPRSQIVPTVEEVQPWISRIIELWDSEAFYNETSRHCRQVAEAYREDLVADQYAAFFQEVVNRQDDFSPGGPIQSPREKRISEDGTLMYRNSYELCHCPVHKCDCAVGVRSYAPHYARVLEIVRPRQVFEWGPGPNTRMALAAGAKVFAIEPVLRWVSPLPLDDPNLAVLVTPTTSPFYLNLHGREDSDVFFVDSRRRAECLDLIREQAKPEAIVCLHDAQRSRYNAALRRFANVTYLDRCFAIASMSELPTALCPG